MTKQEAAALLMTEQLGDSERMELAKHMGAQALKADDLTFVVVPKCGKCGAYIGGVAIREAPEIYGRHTIGPRDIAVAYDFDPWRCHKCKTSFVCADIDLAARTCELMGEDQADDTARDNLVTAIFEDIYNALGELGIVANDQPRIAALKQKYLKGDTTT